jgi:hypothetical protein
LTAVKITAVEQFSIANKDTRRDGSKAFKRGVV